MSPSCNVTPAGTVDFCVHTRFINSCITVSWLLLLCWVFFFFFGHNMMVEFCDYKLILVCFLPVTFKSFPVSETKIIIHIFIDTIAY